MNILKKEFKNIEELKAYQNELFNEPEIKQQVDAVNDRFESLLRHAVTVRHEIREGIRQSDEEIAITIYHWIKKFMSLTRKHEIIENVIVDNVSGRLILDLYEQDLRFEVYASSTNQ